MCWGRLGEGPGPVRNNWDFQDLAQSIKTPSAWNLERDESQIKDLSIFFTATLLSETMLLHKLHSTPIHLKYLPI